jgi:hypothetical protein
MSESHDTGCADDVRGASLALCNQGATQPLEPCARLPRGAEATPTATPLHAQEHSAMAEQTYYQQRAATKFPKAQVSGDGPHGVFLADRQELFLYADFYDARTAADVSSGRLIFISKPVAPICNDNFGYRERNSVSA